MATVGIKPFVNHHGSRRSPEKLMEMKVVQASVNLADILAGDALKLNVTTFIGPSFSANAFVIANPPAALHADLLVFNVEVNDRDDIEISVFNTGISSVNEAAATWDFLVFDF